MSQNHNFSLSVFFQNRRWRWLVLSFLFGAATGCQSYNWRSELAAYKAAEQQAREEGKFLFIFYKWWLDSSSNRMLGNEVLTDPEVVALFQDTINLVVEKDFGPEYEKYMAKYGISDTPACVIVAPDGKFKVRTGFTPKDRFIEFAKRAKAALSTQPQRAAAPRTP